MSDEPPRPPALDPREIYERAEAEGERRLSMTAQDQVMTGFIAGVTIVFGIVALGVVEALVEPSLGHGVAKLAGALAFAVGLVFLIVGRTELFSENFFDPVAAAIAQGGGKAWARLARLWVIILALNLVGGAVLVGVISIDGALPEGAPHALVGAAEEIAGKEWAATLARAVLAGALVALLSCRPGAQHRAGHGGQPGRRAAADHPDPHRPVPERARVSHSAERHPGGARLLKLSSIRAPQVPAELTERVARGLGRDLGVDLHGHRDPAVS